MSGTELSRMTLVRGGGRAALADAHITLDPAGVVTAIEGGGSPNGSSQAATRFLVPPIVDLHLDVLSERRRPRAGVELEQERAIAMLDAELAASGYGTVCICARFEDAPEKGVHLADAVELCELIERHAGRLGCEWLLHARVEVTDEGVVEQLERALGLTRKVALVSVMDHSAERSRFHSLEAHREYYSRDWALPVDEVDRVLERKRAGLAGAEDRRREVAALAARHGLPLASHDDRDAGDVRDSAELGVSLAEFPLSLEAALAARRAGMAVALGAPNAVRGRSTSPTNVTVADAVAAGACDALCADYLPNAMLAGPFALAAGVGMELGAAFDLVTGAPARVLGRAATEIEEGAALDGVLVEMLGKVPIALARWSEGCPVWSRAGAITVPAGV